jgi:hypothetical protein
VTCGLPISMALAIEWAMASPKRRKTGRRFMPPASRLSLPRFAQSGN